ncbi:MAG TPA: hypothetical protein DD670_18335 [Planctomycetaceae bacterium]|nr:hypothetical protein [Planctomycetaceae bacterium]
MADESSVIDFLDQAKKVAGLAAKLGRGFQEDFENGVTGPTHWSRHKLDFDSLRLVLQQLAPRILNPPEGSGAVSQCLRQAAEIVRQIHEGVQKAEFCNLAEYRDYYPNLNSVGWELDQAIKHVQKTLNSIDRLASLDEVPEVSLPTQPQEATATSVKAAASCPAVMSTETNEDSSVLRNSDGQSFNPGPGNIWTVEDYYRVKRLYEENGAVFNPALEKGSPAAYHVIAQAKMRAEKGDARTFIDVLAGDTVSPEGPKDVRRAYNQLVVRCD